MNIREHKWFRTVLLYVFVPFIMEIIIESLSRKSLIAGVQYLFSSPLLFVFNTLIIMLTLSVAMFFKREVFVYAVISAIWLIFGIANYIILHFRVTPFSAVDFTLIKSAISVSGHYFSALNIAMMILAVILVAVGMILLYRKAPRHKGRSYQNIVLSAAIVICLVIMIAVLRGSSSSVQALSTNYTNISEAYENFGFVYCFANSILDTGIAEPENYSEEAVKDVVGSLEKKHSMPPKKPNIIMIQLESFFDINYVKGLSYSEDPIPVFHSLQKKYSHGLLTVPTVGAGTVNTEFEVLTGMNQNDFGVSEYPYKTVLKSMTMESICYDLDKLGYSTHCVHNNEATFYGRQKVFRNLGFDSFTPMEYMNGLEENPNGWVKDNILADEIIKTLDSTDGTDFTFGITVQSHGKYDVVMEDEDEKMITVKSAPEGMENSYTYYVNQIADVDKMLGELIKKLDERKDRSVLVLYGDHLPSLDLTKDEIKNGNLYQTPYVIWDNMDLDKETKNLYAYQLYPEVLNRIGIHEGLITRYHQQMDWSSADYLTNLTLLEYDMLYGEMYTYDGGNPFLETETQLGTERVKITDIVKNDSGYLVTGNGFTEYAHILFNGDKLEGKWVDENHIQITDEITYDFDAEPINLKEARLQKIAPQDIPNTFVVQVIDDDGIVLSTSDALFWDDTSLEMPEFPEEDNEDEVQ